MRKLEALLGVLAGIAGLGTAGLALFIVGSQVFGFLTAPQVAEMPATDSAAAAADGTSAAPAVADTATQASPETPAPVVAASAISIERGETVFKKCKACHTVDEGGKTLTGPNLWSVVGRQAAAVDGYAYSDAMNAQSSEIWDVARLDAYLTKPKDLVPGTKMTFAGLKKADDRQSVILYLAQASASPQSAADLGFDAGPATAAPAAAATDTAAAAAEDVAIDPVPYPEGVTYANPAARSAEDDTRIAALVTELAAIAPTLDYERSRYHPLHFPPAIETASSEECLVCHQEIMDNQPLEVSPAGIPASETYAWYQTLDTYTGMQETFHYRHMQSEFAQQVMNLECTFCHKGNDPREESPDMMPGRAAFSANAAPEFTLRKMVNPSETCLRCHGTMPDPEGIMGIADAWPVARLDMEFPEAPNGCMSCHAETFRTVRHNVEYLNAANIEELARAGSSDTCYGCHGGRSWYRISYPYPRHVWPGMEDMVGTEVPEWAVGRATESDPQYALPAAAE